MAEPSRLLQKLSDRLFTAARDRAAFMAHLTTPHPFPAAMLWSQPRPAPAPFTPLTPLPWQPPWVDRVPPETRPGRHPLHDQGAFYCLDFSSVFAATPLMQLPPSPPVVLDLCAAPGGKSVFAWRALQPQLLLSNEVIGKRLPPLLANLKRCGIHPAIALRHDAQYLAQALPHTATVVLVDAPCSGQSLLAKGRKAPGCFHPVTIKRNAQRQKRILANAAQLVAPGGHLLYMTCTYSPAENEDVVAWLLQRFPAYRAIAVPALAPYQSHLTDQPSYRLFPQQALGAGAFTALLQNTATGPPSPLPETLREWPGAIAIAAPS